MKKKKEKRIKRVLLKAFSKVELKTCNVCGSFISVKEHKDGHGACFKCWSK